MTYTLEQLKERLARILDDPTMRRCDVTIYYEIVDASHNVHATTRVFPYEKETANEDHVV